MTGSNIEHGHFDPEPSRGQEDLNTDGLSPTPPGPVIAHLESLQRSHGLPAARGILDTGALRLEQLSSVLPSLKELVDTTIESLQSDGANGSDFLQAAATCLFLIDQSAILYRTIQAQTSGTAGAALSFSEEFTPEDLTRCSSFIDACEAYGLELKRALLLHIPLPVAFELPSEDFYSEFLRESAIHSSIRSYFGEVPRDLSSAEDQRSVQELCAWLLAKFEPNSESPEDIPIGFYRLVDELSRGGVAWLFERGELESCVREVRRIAAQHLEQFEGITSEQTLTAPWFAAPIVGAMYRMGVETRESLVDRITEGSMAVAYGLMHCAATDQSLCTKEVEVALTQLVRAQMGKFLDKPLVKPMLESLPWFSQHIFSSFSNTMGARVFKRALREFSDQELELWKTFVDHRNSLDRSYQVTPTDLTLAGVSNKAIRSLYSAVPSMHDADLVASALLEKFDGEVINQLISVSGGAMRKLLAVGRMFSKEGVGGEKVTVSRQELLSTTNLDRLIDRLADRFLEALAPTIDQVQDKLLLIAEEGGLSRPNPGSSPSGADVKHIQSCVSTFRERIVDALNVVLHRGGGLSVQGARSSLLRDDFQEIASGHRDLTMMLPATSPREALVTDLFEVMSSLYPQGLLESNVNRKLPNLTGKLGSINRGRLRKRILREIGVNREGTEITDASAVAEALRDPTFQRKALIPALVEEGYAPSVASVRVALKSDPSTWTSGDQVVCCASFGAPNQQDFLSRCDASHVLIEQDGLVTAMAVIWYGQDEDTLIVNNIEVAPAYLEHADTYRDIIREFLADYVQEEIPACLDGQRAPKFSRIQIGMKTGDVDLKSLPDAQVVVPKGDSPDTRGKWNRGHSDADSHQRIFWTSST